MVKASPRAYAKLDRRRHVKGGENVKARKAKAFGHRGRVATFNGWAKNRKQYSESFDFCELERTRGGSDIGVAGRYTAKEPRIMQMS